MEDIDNWQAKFEPCQYSDKLLGKITLLNKAVQNPVDIQEVKKAIYYARKYHGSQTRDSGEPYYSHPLEVAYMVADYLLKTDVIVASILHDVVEDTEITIETVGKKFGIRVAEIVERVTKIKSGAKKITLSEILAISDEHQDKEAILLKTCDRIHNLQTIGNRSILKQQKVVRETIDTLLPYAIKLEIYALEEMITQLCFSIFKGKLYKMPDLFQNPFDFSLQDIYQNSSLIFQNDE